MVLKQKRYRFFCNRDLNVLGPKIKVANNGLNEVWNSPMADFLTYGDYGMSADGRQECYSTSNSWVALKEK